MKAFIAAAAGFAASSWYTSATTSSTSCTTQTSPFSQSEFRSFPLLDVYDESHNTKVFRFALPEADMPLNLEVASCVSFRYVDKDGTEVVRPYTPLNRSDQLGYFDVMVKNYQGSKMGSHLFAMRKGDCIDVKGPWVKLPIKSNQYKAIGMLAGGTGITPMYQVARNILRAPKNTTEITLVYANERKEDVLFGNELNQLMEAYPRFSPYFVLSKAPSDWMGGVGYINKEMIKSLMPAPNRAGDSIILVCGPPPFMETISGDKDFKSYPPSQGELKGYLKELGYMPKMVFKF
ncbi:putative mitochondrial NADH-cytochrome b5 reductase [Leptomonas pyrrhocoris]|uniref:NADH-cytochrome b5 reductase n=1 Tax=Leptomonas pyrrhocoris TaxID=157538 RepID=A0A0M9G9Q6_LEPPY|nr:putative mitochondrial NADH-cytochrome b5 reductase [Leptomonas pyrrhocoris]XP_015664133.1 putative mitochondrial NADH-cytochrome b5 reductase [Leptomonas pyrrhocoris]KPA85693.1 putative mitochondrial NADH-cytochrome b5 reductase [Leptomonas pyrrhocoris]KPA85694.1 putative mitochondrial NADH-cytochrome b5 reductase [Leptomonas pyrrhocoris]|eukprot:XP_015664132.1 putative mitochondrial NADH-cytochrome b5 reductase [Leptomonas pyrrhocoris]